MKANTGRSGELRPAEVAATRTWLSKRGIEVNEPTRLLSLRIGPRSNPVEGSSFRWIMGAAIVGALLNFAYGYLGELPGVRAEDMTDTSYLYFFATCTQLAFWLAILRRERALGPLPVMDERSGRPSALAVLGGWYLASFLITFLGGAALAAAMYLTTPDKTYAWSWLGVLGWAALCCAVILFQTLRRPVYAEDTASAAVDTALRTTDSQIAMTAVYAPAVLLDLLFSHRAPAEFTWWLVAYAVLAVATTVIGIRRQNRRIRTLPPGDYEASDF
ncbi:hypothetical protein [Amycolatopsis sp. lyj-112]|uniref:hypothetical protein n=1 Tax=Amycolatopsis sp. lyj-112 TaxID=2789288 RepID=UPI0039783859